LDESKERVAKFAENNKLSYVILLNGRQVFQESYKGGSIPQTYLLDREGQVVCSQVGWNLFDPGKFEREIEKLLDHPASKSTTGRKPQ
jgi:hypothetical protein